jgi:hypothetical protein
MARRVARNCAPAPDCAPTGDLRAMPDGNEWCAVDATGSAWAANPMPELCPCYPPDSPLRVRMDTGDRAGSTVGGSRHYGAGLPAATWIPGHTHNALGGEVFYTSLSALPLACGHRLPPSRHTQPLEPLDTDRVPPVCCGWPMRWAPRGWNCRVRNTWQLPALPDLLEVLDGGLFPQPARVPRRSRRVA